MQLSYGQEDSGICLQDYPYRLCSLVFAMPSSTLFYLMDKLSLCRNFPLYDPLSNKEQNNYITLTGVFSAKFLF